MADFGKIALGVRVGKHVDASFFFCWTSLLRSRVLRPHDVVLNPAVGLPHCMAANVLTAHFMATACDALLFLDDDMEFNPQAIDVLRGDDHGFDVVSCLAVTRKPMHAPIVMIGNDADTGKPVPAPADEIEGVVPVKYVGLAGTLVKRWVLEEVSKLYVTEPPFRFNPNLGEDGQFSADAESVGAKLAVNCNVRFGHRVEMALYWNTKARRLDFSENDFGMASVINQEEKGNTPWQ